MLPAALPVVGTDWAAQAERWEGGREVRDKDCWRASGASIRVAMSPEATCHSMWQWKSQTRAKRGER